jgi:hypothetical protein
LSGRPDDHQAIKGLYFIKGFDYPGIQAAEIS